MNYEDVCKECGAREGEKHDAAKHGADLKAAAERDKYAVPEQD